MTSSIPQLNTSSLDDLEKTPTNHPPASPTSSDISNWSETTAHTETVVNDLKAGGFKSSKDESPTKLVFVYDVTHATLPTHGGDRNSLKTKIFMTFKVYAKPGSHFGPITKDDMKALSKELFDAESLLNSVENMARTQGEAAFREDDEKPQPKAPRHQNAPYRSKLEESQIRESESQWMNTRKTEMETRRSGSANFSGMNIRLGYKSDFPQSDLLAEGLSSQFEVTFYRSGTRFSCTVD